MHSMIRKAFNRLKAAIGNLFTEVKYRYFRHIQNINVEEPPIYIVGCGHSGTSLLLAILGAHSRLFSIPGESYLAFKTDEQKRRLLQEFERKTITAGKQRWVEKTPTHVRQIDELLHMNPDAYIIVMLRDGRDVACSIGDRTGDFEQGVKRWVRDNQEAEKYLSEERLCRIRYEKIIEDFDKAIGKVICFCNEEFERSLRHYHEQSKYYFSKNISKPKSVKDGEKHDQHRNWQINQPIFDGRGRWKKEMSEEEKKIFKNIAGDMLIKYGYEENDKW